MSLIECQHHTNCGGWCETNKEIEQALCGNCCDDLITEDATQHDKRFVRRDVTPAEAMAILSAAMQEDYGYAWSWHCNIAMVAQDAGAPHKEANERAADFMCRAFGVDTSLPPND